MTPISNAEKRERLNRLSEEDWMRWAYLPFVVAEGAWDYADTIISLTVQLKMKQTKNLRKAVRRLKRDYDKRRLCHAMTSSGHELDNFMVVEDVSRKSFNHMYARIRESSNRQYPAMDEDHRMLLLAVHACATVLDVLYKYMEVQEAHVCEVCGFESISSILPPEIAALRALVPKFAADNPLKVSERGLFIHNIVRGLCNVPFTSEKIFEK